MAAAALPITADGGIQIDTIPYLHEFVNVPGNNIPHQTLALYAQRTPLTENVAIPGNAQGARTDRGTVETLRLLRQWYGAFWTMHRSGHTLAGVFGLDNFVVHARTTMAVRMQDVHLIKYCSQFGNKDYETFVISVEQFFACANKPVPRDIRYWLNLIAEGVKGNEYLIRYHIALMEPVQAFGFLMTGKGILESLRNDPNWAWLFHRIVSWHPHLFNWMKKNCSNLLLLSAQLYIQGEVQAKRLKIDSDLRGVLKLWRDTRHHPASLYEDFMILIIEDDFPGEAARFQRSLFNARLLGMFRLEATMG